MIEDQLKGGCATLYKREQEASRYTLFFAQRSKIDSFQIYILFYYIIFFNIAIPNLFSYYEYID